MDQLSFHVVILLILSVVSAAPSEMEVGMIKVRKECEKLPGTPIQLGHCCKFPQLAPDQHALACFKEIAWDDSDPLLSSCKIHECHFKKANFMHGTKIDKKQLIQFTKKVFTNHTNWVENGIKAFDMCVDHEIMYKDDIRHAFESHQFDLKKCNPMFMSVETCAFMYMFRNCPADAWISNETCEKWKKHIEMCHHEEETIVMLNNVTAAALQEEGVTVL